jgi:HEAT repeat protein
MNIRFRVHCRPGVSWALLTLPAALLLVLASGCANQRYLGTTATSYLKFARDSGDPNIRHDAYARLANPNCYDNENQRAESATFLASRLDERKEPTVTRAVICRTLGELREPEARESLRRACDDPEAVVRAAACRALGRFQDPEDASVLARIMAADLDADCRIAAIEGLGWMKIGDGRIEVTLIDGMENADPAIRLASYEALQRIAGMDLGPDPAAWKARLLQRSEAIANSGDNNAAAGSREPGAAGTIRRR